MYLYLEQDWNQRVLKLFVYQSNFFAVLPWIPPGPILSAGLVLNVSSDKSSECFMPRNPDLGHRQNKSGSLNIELFFTLNKNTKQQKCRTVLGRFALNWVIGALDTQIETSKGGGQNANNVILGQFMQNIQIFHKIFSPLFMGKIFEWQRSRVLISAQFTAYEGWK